MKSRTSSRALAWVGLLMLMLSLTPVGLEVAAAQNAGLPVAQEDVAQNDVAQGTGSFLEVHISTCEPGTTGTPQELRDICHDNGVAGAQLTVRSVDPALGVDLPKTTERINDAGPGIINTGTIPAGEYRVEMVVPIENSTFVVGCEYFDRDETVPVTPNNDQNFNVTVPQGEDIVCDLYVIPNPAASITITMHQCDRAALPGDGRTFEDLTGPCTTVPTEPVKLTLRDSADVPTEQTLDAEGKTTFANLAPGTWEIFSDLDRDVWGEYLFCTLDGGERYEKEFDENVVATFTDVGTEQIACDWFAVRAPQGAPTATVAPTTEVTATVAPAETTVPPTATAVPPTEVPTSTASEADQGLNIAPPADVAPVVGTATLLLHVQTCDLGYEPGTVDFATFSADCPNRAPDVGFTLQGAGNTVQATTNGDGNVVFTGLLGDASIFSGVPLEAATENLFCSVDGGDVYQKEFNTSGVTSFTNFLPDETVECSWYIVPLNQRVDETGGTVTVHLSACPVGYTGSNYFNDCHGNGVGDLPFTLSGAATEITANTVIETTPGPGLVTFSGLPAGEFTLAGGPPQDFGTVALYCSVPATGEQFDAPMEGGIARFTLGEQQSILCDWYFIPEDASGGVTPTPEPTQVPQKAEIFVTLFECDPSLNTAGASFGDLDSQCAQTINDVPMSLGIPGGTPLSANTGASGDGAVRFFELQPGDYVMKPSLPSGYANIAVFCQIGDGDVYQKPIQSGSTTFVDVEGEQIACSWFAAKTQPAPAQPAAPAGSITVREFLCEGDKTSITDWERECVPGSTGTAFTLTASDGSLTRNAAPNDAGVLVFGELPDGYYELKQDTGVWCRAAAERVDSQSRVIVSGGANTDVFLYECNQSVDLPNTGSGVSAGLPDHSDLMPLLLGLLAIPLFAVAIWQSRRTQAEPVRVPVSPNTRRTTAQDAQPEPTASDRIRFR